MGMGQHKIAQRFNVQLFQIRQQGVGRIGGAGVQQAGFAVLQKQYRIPLPHVQHQNRRAALRRLRQGVGGKPGQPVEGIPAVGPLYYIGSEQQHRSQQQGSPAAAQPVKNRCAVRLHHSLH